MSADRMQGGAPLSVAVIGGAGLIGAGVACQLAGQDMAEHLYLLDPRENLLQAHAIDIAEAQAVSSQMNTALHVVDAHQAIPEVDLVIVAASAPETPAGDRRDFLHRNAALLQQLAPVIGAAAGRRASILLLSNPVDVLCGVLQRLLDVDPGRIVGYSYNDSIRFRLALARELGCVPQRIDGVVLGEHGAGQVPLFSRATCDDRPLDLDEHARRRVRADIDGWFERWSALRPGRSSGWTTPAGTIVQIRAMGTGAVFPASVATAGQGEFADAYITLPAILHRAGCRSIVDWTLGADERDALGRAAASVAARRDRVLRELGI